MGIVIKSPKQIQGIRKSCVLAARTLRFLEPQLKPGISTKRLEIMADWFMREHRATPATLHYPHPHNHSHLYPASCCISVNEVVCHGIPDDYVLKEGDIVSIDVTTILEGYYGDCCATFAVGEISEGARRLLRVTKECLDLGLAQVRPGNYFGNIGYEIGRYAGDLGYGVVQDFCGHGVGLAFHEQPQICHVASKDSGPRMVPGMIFTIEPMINEGSARVLMDQEDHWTARTADGKLSAQFEHTILVTPEGHEVLTYEG